MKAEVSIVQVTPTLARGWLSSKVEGQRNLRETHVASLADEIVSGKWHLTCDAITLIRGLLGNGQHRCEAIVRTNTTCEKGSSKTKYQKQSYHNHTFLAF